MRFPVEPGAMPLATKERTLPVMPGLQEGRCQRRIQRVANQRKGNLQRNFELIKHELVKGSH